MQTLYIDIYFLLNFTVDLLSLYFAAIFSGIRSSAKRLIISSVLAALFACFAVLIPLKGIIFIIMIILTGIVITLIFAKGASYLRMTKLFISFLIFETFIGGLVNCFYGILDNYIYQYFKDSNFGTYNSNLILISVLVLLSYAVIKMLFLIFSGRSAEENKNLSICFLGKKEDVTALVDSGNLLVDPLSGKPVILIKKNMVKLFSDCSDIINSNDDEIKKRIRLIPAKGIGSSKIYTGIRCDFIMLEDEKIKYENAVIALDDEEGSYGGYAALMPSSVALGRI